MSSPTRDEIAREAARLLEVGKAATVVEALDRAMEVLHAPPRQRPSIGRVRRHIQGFTMQALGDAGYRAEVRRMWEVAEEAMTVFEEFDPVLSGRAAKGQIDGGVTLHIRIYTRSPLGPLVERLERYGYEDVRIDTINTRWGRLNRLLCEDDGYPIVITRCLPEMRDHADRNLHRDEPVNTSTLREVRRRLALD